MNLVEREVSAATMKALFGERFGHAPTVIAAAPGRVNLIGEHTDYNNGFVMPMALERHTAVAVGPSPSGKVRLSDSNVSVCRFEGTPSPGTRSVSADADNAYIEIDLDQIDKKGEPFWTNYVRGVFAELKKLGIDPGAVDLVVDSNVPRGGGLSSSAALEVSVATALCAYVGKSLSPKEIALLGQRVEHEFAGVPCGIMDQFISAHGKAGHALKLDCASLEYELAPLADPNVSILIINSSVKHSLADGAYAKRRKSCQEAAEILGVPSLRDATLEMVEAAKEKLGDERYRRARHIVTECARVGEFARDLAQGSWAEAGKAMVASHYSLKDDYEVSCDELDILVKLSTEIPSADAVYGARMTGGGFGGCIVALVKTEKVDEVASEMLAAYKSATGIDTECLISRPGDGARVIS